jgi:hypothetical protein
MAQISARCCPSCSADILSVGKGGLCWRCRKPIPQELLVTGASREAGAARSGSDRPATSVELLVWKYGAIISASLPAVFALVFTYIGVVLESGRLTFSSVFDLWGLIASQAWLFITAAFLMLLMTGAMALFGPRPIHRTTFSLSKIAASVFLFNFIIPVMDLFEAGHGLRYSEMLVLFCVWTIIDIVPVVLVVRILRLTQDQGQL